MLAEHPRVVVLDAQRPQAGLEHEIVDRVLQLVLRRIAEGNRLARQRRDAWE